ncbi:MAG: hypothetical protein GY778_19480 [bacterium]|nr:hypothetical protein [bacterium]
MTDDSNQPATPANPGPLYEKLVDQLTRAGIEFSTLQHRPVYTSAEAAAVRGVDLHSGAKALVIKAGQDFVMIVMPADLSLDSKATKNALGCKSIRFAKPDEVYAITQLEPGAIPPFGGLFGLKTYCDERLAESTRINFNAGAHDHSVSMTWDGYLAAECPTLGRYGTEPQS